MFICEQHQKKYKRDSRIDGIYLSYEWRDYVYECLKENGEDYLAYKRYIDDLTADQCRRYDARVKERLALEGKDLEIALAYAEPYPKVVCTYEDTAYGLKKIRARHPFLDLIHEEKNEERKTEPQKDIEPQIQP